MSPPDTILLERWRARRDASAFNEIVSRYAGMVYATCRRILKNAADAEDASQECFLRLFQRNLEPRISLGAWLHRVATNTSLTLLKSQARRRRRELRSSLDANSAEYDAPTWNEVQDHVDEAIDGLPDELRDVVTSHFLRRETYDAIARRLRTTPRKVSYRVEKGVKLIRTRLAAKGLSVAAPVLAGLLSTNAVEAAPGALLAALGRLALSGVTRTPVGVGTAARQAGALSASSSTASVARRTRPGKSGLIASIAASIIVVTVGVVLLGVPDRLATDPTRSSTLASSPSDPGDRAEDAARPEAPPTGAIGGSVRDATTGEPVERARLRVSDLEVVAEESGDYALTKLPDKTHAVTVSAPGYTERTVDVEVKGGSETRIDFHLEAALVGLVVDVRGQPVPGASVSLVRQKYRPGTTYYTGIDELSRASVDENGTFQLDVSPDRTSVLIQATAPGHAYSVARFTNPKYYREPFYDYVRGKACEELTFILFPAVQLTGRIVDESGEPVAGARVWIRDVGGTVLTDERGRFVLEKVRPSPAGPIGSHDRVGVRHADFVETELVASRVGAPPVFSGGKEILIVEESADPDIVLESGVLVKGRISDADTGRGLPGFGVAARWSGGSASAHSDDTGRYSVRFPAVGREAQLHPFVAIGYGAESSNYFALAEQVTIPPEEFDEILEFDFEFRKGLRVRGRVMDAETGEPVENIYVEARPANTSEASARVYWRRKSASSGVAGEFVLEGLKVGVYELTFSAVISGRTTKLASQQVDLSDGIDLPALEVLVERKNQEEAGPAPMDEPPTATVEGLVISPDGDPVPFPVIRRYSHGPVTAHGDIDGRFTIPRTGKWAGGGALRVWDGTRELYGVHDLRDSAANEGPITVRLQPSATIAGTVRDARGGPVPGLLVEVSMRRESTSTAIVTAFTDEEGRYELKGYRPRPEDEDVIVRIREPFDASRRTAPRLIHGDRSFHRCAKLPVVSSIPGLDFRITDGQQVVAESR